MAKTKKQSYPHFTHTQIVNHDIIGRCKVYHFNRVPSSADSGSQTDFFPNGAEVDNPKQYGIKLFSTSIEAFAAYQRQKIAADAGLAPPVGVMVRFVIRDKKHNRSVNRWGYETCLADCSTFARMTALVLSSPYVTSYYEKFCKESNLLPWTQYSLDQYKKSVDKLYEAGIIRYSFNSISQECPDAESLRFRLRDLNIIGTQYDDISEAYTSDDFCEAWRNPRLRLGETWKKSDDPYMLNDVHSFNIGLWKGDAVCIDFGYHIACPSYRYYEEV